MLAIRLVSVKCQITLTHHSGAKRPPPLQERGANNKLGSYNYPLLLVYVTGYRILGALSKSKDIALSDSVG